jgi:hypothetical protein
MNQYSSIDNSGSEFWNLDVKKVTFNNLGELPKKAFIHNQFVEEVSFKEDPNLNKIDSHAFFATENLKKVDLYYGSELEVGSHAFYGSGLEKIGNEFTGLDIKNNTIDLTGEYTFAYMPNLEDVQVTDSLNEGVIPKGTFYSDPKLEKVILEDDIKELKREAFGNNEGLKTFVMYGDTKIADIDEHKEVEFTDTNKLIFTLKDNIDNFEIKITDSDNQEFVLTKETFGNNTNYTYTVDSPKTITKIETDNDIFIDDNDNNIDIREYSDIVLPIDSHANLYCYLVNPDCNEYALKYSDLKEDHNSDLYYLDEVLYLGANKQYIKLTEDKEHIETDGLILYGLRRDGILLVSEEYGKMTDNVKYVDSGITIRDYDANTTDPRKMVFNTSKDPRYIDLESNDNFENIEYEIGTEDPETGRANVDFIYMNIIVHTQPTTVLKTKGNFVDVIYADGCGGESFANEIHEDVPKGGQTPSYEGGEPTREGYRFLGWDKEISDTADEDVVYTAVWEKIEDEHQEINKDPNPNGDSGLDIPDTLKNYNKIFIIIILINIIISGVIIYRRKKY